MIALLLRLYPARWRTRYGDEFGALLAERPLGPFDVADVLLGALDAHLHLRGLGSWSDHRRGVPMTLRVGGLAAFAAGSLMLIAFLAAQVRSDLANLLLVAGLVNMPVAVAGLSSHQFRAHPGLTWAAFLGPAVGVVVALIGGLVAVVWPSQSVVGPLGGFELFFTGFLIAIAGTAVFAIASLWSRTLPRTGVLALAIGSAFALAWAALLVFAKVTPPEPLAFVLQLGPLAFAGGWAVLGALTLREYHSVPSPDVA